MNDLPILYSCRRCPYAIRARMALMYADICVEIKEVQLNNKPEHLLLISPKATVPVLQLANGKVIAGNVDDMVSVWKVDRILPNLTHGKRKTGFQSSRTFLGSIAFYKMIDDDCGSSSIFKTLKKPLWIFQRK